MSTENGESDQPQSPLELSDILNIETQDGHSRAFEVVGILEDPEDGSSYAVLRHESPDEGEDEFIVTDLDGNLLQDDELAQEILDDFLAFAHEDVERHAHNGEAG
jgi:uncharacterized protein YrzB (UPF0473 family)